jgi:transcription initiation factor IIE alpha subunit
VKEGKKMFNKESYCPNTKCIFNEKLMKGQKCPSCGTVAEEFGLSEASELLKQKEQTRILMLLFMQKTSLH